MTPTTPNPPRRRRATLTERAATLTTGHQWRRCHAIAVQVSAVWGGCAAGAALFGGLSVVQTDQAVSVYTGLMRPVPPTLTANMQRLPQSAWTPANTAQMLPQGWTLSAYYKAAQRCQERPKCAAQLRAGWWWWWWNQPKNHPAQVMQWCMAGMLLTTLPALSMWRDLRDWRDWERRTVDHHTQAVRRAARGGNR